MCPHQELVDQDESTGTRGLHFVENLGPQSVGWRRVEIGLGLVPSEDVETLLTQELPSEQIPWHPEAPLLSGRRHDLAALHPIHLVEGDSGHASGWRGWNLRRVEDRRDRRGPPG